jgi:cytoskeleton protein RodZ
MVGKRRQPGVDNAAPASTLVFSDGLAGWGSIRVGSAGRIGGVIVPREVVSLKTTNGPALSDSEAMFVEASDAPRAGADLRAARERLCWALPDVAAILRIRPSFLEALEDGCLTRLPGNVYALGFLRSYATALGLDPDEVARRFRAEAGEIQKHSELVFPAPVADRGLPAGALILLGLILVGGAYIGWYRLSGEGRLPAETVIPVPARLASLAEQALPGPDGRVTIPEPVAPAPSPVARQPDDDNQFEPRQAAAENPLLLPDPAPPPPPPPIEEMHASIPGATATTAIAMPVTPPLRRAEEPVQRPTDPSSAAGDPEASRVMLRFTGDTWVQVKERGGQTLLSKVMKAGETFAVPGRDNLILTTGNAGRVDILVDGTLVAPLGGAGAVRKDVPLDPDQLKSGPVVPASTKR